MDEHLIESVKTSLIDEIHKEINRSIDEVADIKSISRTKPSVEKALWMERLDGEINGLTRAVKIVEAWQMPEE